MTDPVHNDDALTVRLAVHLDSEPVRGQLWGEHGDPEQFVGWIGFVEALKRAQDTNRTNEEIRTMTQTLTMTTTAAEASGAPVRGTVTSADGTEIGVTRAGTGPSLILVDGALSYREMGVNGALAEELAKRFTIFTYDRRGRGETSDREPWTLDREIEDLDAVIAEAGASAFVYGISSGAALALEAAVRLPGIAKLALFEAPFVVDDTRPPIPVDLARQCQERVDANRRGAAVKLFMKTGVRVPAVFVALMQVMPAWPKLKRLAHTLPYDLTILGQDTGSGEALPAERWASAGVPTLVVAGGRAPRGCRTR